MATVLSVAPGGQSASARVSHVSTTTTPLAAFVWIAPYGVGMHLVYTDGREIAELVDFHTQGKSIGTAPINYTASISIDGARRLQQESAAFYRGRAGAARFTLTVDGVNERTLSGTVRRR